MASPPFFRACVLALILAAPAARAQPAIGSVALSDGPLVAQRADGAKRLIATGSTVVEGETLITGPQSHARVRFADDATLLLTPSSRLRIVRYRFDAGEPSGDAVELELLAGGLQSTAGRIGKRSPDAVTLHTTGGDLRAGGGTFIVSLQAPPAATPRP